MHDPQSNDSFDLYMDDIENAEAELLPAVMSAKSSTASTIGCAACVGGSTAGTFSSVGTIIGTP